MNICGDTGPYKHEQPIYTEALMINFGVGALFDNAQIRHIIVPVYQKSSEIVYIGAIYE